MQQLAEAELATSGVPFIVRNRPSAQGPAPFETETTRVMVPPDGSRFSEGALETAATLVDGSGNLILVTVISERNHVEYDEAAVLAGLAGGGAGMRGPRPA